MSAGVDGAIVTDLSPLEVLRLYPQHDGTLDSALECRSGVAQQRTFIVYQGQSLSYAQARERVERTAAVLAAQGVRAGDRVGVVSPNHPSIVMLFFGLARLGAIMVPVNPEYGVEETKYVLAHAGVCGLVSAPGALATVRAAYRDIAELPWLMLADAAPQGSQDADLPVLSERARLWSGALPPAMGAAGTTCLFIYTSGTTGFPKGVMHSQRSVLTAGEGFVERMHLQPDDRLLCVLPMFHVNAICYSLLGALAAGATLVLEPKFSASTFWTTVHDTGATEVNTIAAASAILMRRPRSEFVPGHRLRKMYGAPFDAETFRVFQHEFGVATLIEGYGMSEIPGALSNPFPGPHKIGSMGTPNRHPDPAISLAELRVADEQGRDVPTGQVGELVVRTPIVMQGYYRDAVQTKAAFRDGWFLTGDLATMDEDHYFWFVARKKDVIRSRGENISGAELDRVIGAHPAVLAAAAIPVPSSLGEDDILAAIVVRPGSTLEPEAIAQWCRERLSAVKVPRYVVFVASLPHTPTHRVAKFKLREDASLLARAHDLQATRS